MLCCSQPSSGGSFLSLFPVPTGGLEPHGEGGSRRGGKGLRFGAEKWACSPEWLRQELRGSSWPRSIVEAKSKMWANPQKKHQSDGQYSSLGITNRFPTAAGVALTGRHGNKTKPKPKQGS